MKGCTQGCIQGSTQRSKQGSQYERTGNSKKSAGAWQLVQLVCLTLALLFGQAGLAQNAADAVLQERVNINQADAETIAAVLDGVGLSRAEAIVDYRETNGDFKSLEELMMVSGIGEATLRNNRDRIDLQ